MERTLESLRVDPAETSEWPNGIPRDTLEIVLQELPDGLLQDLEGSPSVREDRLEEARGRLEHGDEPSPDELADRIVGRLVCDRLR